MKCFYFYFNNVNIEIIWRIKVIVDDYMIVDDYKSFIMFDRKTWSMSYCPTINFFIILMILLMIFLLSCHAWYYSNVTLGST